jgi:hypothetical protein
MWMEEVEEVAWTLVLGLVLVEGVYVEEVADNGGIDG